MSLSIWILGLDGAGVQHQGGTLHRRIHRYLPGALGPGWPGWLGGGQVVQSMHVFWAAGTLVKIFTGILKGIVLLVKASSARFRKVLRFQTEGAFN